MSISQKIEIYHKNRVENIRKMSNGIDRDMAIGAFAADLGQRSIKPLAKAIGSCFRKVKSCFEMFHYGVQTKIELRGRKKVEDKFPKIRNQIKDILKTYEYNDSHFKTETLFVDLSLQNLRNELILRYSYTVETCPCKSTLLRLLTDLGYKIQKVKKTKVLDKIPETDAIFDNISYRVLCSSGLIK